MEGLTISSTRHGYTSVREYGRPVNRGRWVSNGLNACNVVDELRVGLGMKNATTRWRVECRVDEQGDWRL